MRSWKCRSRQRRKLNKPTRCWECDSKTRFTRKTRISFLFAERYRVTYDLPCLWCDECKNGIVKSPWNRHQEEAIIKQTPYRKSADGMTWVLPSED